jgi:C-terminal processing protease CtpA/Prc
MKKQPVFVLTSKRTFSGAEEFAFDLTNQKRATIVRETTGGSAHPVSEHTVADYFTVSVPFAKSLDSVTKTNWEGTGVEPDVKVPAADALATAEKLAMEKIQAKRNPSCAFAQGITEMLFDLPVNDTFKIFLRVRPPTGYLRQHVRHSC